MKKKQTLNQRWTPLEVHPREMDSSGSSPPRNGRQTEDMVALRALARSLQTTIEQFQCCQGQVCDTHSVDSQSIISSDMSESSTSSHQMLDWQSQVTDLTQENDALRQELAKSKNKLDQTEAALLQCKAETIRSRAELVSVASQLREEQKIADDLRYQLLRYQASAATREFKYDLDQAAPSAESAESFCRRHEEEYPLIIAKTRQPVADDFGRDNIWTTSLGGPEHDCAIIKQLEVVSGDVEASYSVEKEVANLEQALKALRASLADVDNSI